MKKIIVLILLVMVALSACAEGKQESGSRPNDYGSAVYNNSYENIGYNEIQELFPGGMITYLGYFSTYDDVNNSFFIKAEKKYFNENDYFKVKPFSPDV